ncbi:hypothetical protein COCSUDRAFT_55046 [Coccomyxa subellipsoidea C-169]|uniref:Uncharacterized protein n=1 Tax=Coccomyxa subellipsoidea (strain C-169) TaxID=574566 RepID=I0YI31_COCSC|nr:hypothetical protein COCSUDRAFT_55046 [Coccomyxa subellipsoidea C-169]EIE18050.1 hypothetical protein COCSUDRAFT_55046 [Coccomyxa subellipsoidea C-169]|eukprot:XP_005642594.1 hypothetical protein COCSUDRAFT_55046 [Coccomyxa subellipsoidea C-169]
MHALTTEVFSQLHFVNDCPGELHGLEKKVYIEPLVGHMRHPRALDECSLTEAKVHVMDVSYLLVNPWPASDFLLLYPGKRYLLDCGTSTFDTSLMFLTTRYRQSGIEFDRIWAWEAEAQPSRAYWDAVPDIYKSRLHYYNTPITDDIAHADHPLSVIRDIYRPGDFIALKLDIDNSPLETAIVEAIGNDPHLVQSIGEMFYEQHYIHREMAPYFGTNLSVTLEMAQRSLGKLRQMGLIVHYWP